MYSRWVIIRDKLVSIIEGDWWRREGDMLLVDVDGWLSERDGLLKEGER